MSESADTPKPRLSDMIAVDKLYLILGLKTGDRAQLTWQDRERLGNLEFAVRQAVAVGRVQRFARKDPRSQEVLGYYYLREEIRHIIHNRG